jgi:hypothetical protein
MRGLGKVVREILSNVSSSSSFWTMYTYVGMVKLDGDG